MVQFDKQSADRIAKVVQHVEAQPQTQGVGDSGSVLLRGGAIHWQRGWNNASEEIPPFSCVQLDGGSQIDELFHASMKKPDSDGKVYGLTGQVEIEANRAGGYHVEAGIATYDTGTPTVGETWGPKEGQWTLAKDKPGYVCLGVIDSEAKLMLVVPSPPRNATRCNALLSAAYTSGDPTATVNNVVPLDGASPVESSSDELTVTVIFSGWGDADEDSNCKIEWNATDERWEMYQMDCGGEE